MCDEEEEIIDSRGENEGNCDKVIQFNSIQCVATFNSGESWPSKRVVNSHNRRVRVSTLPPFWD